MANKSKLTAIFALVLPVIFSGLLAGCLLGDDIETLRSKAEITVPGTFLAAKLSWLESNARSGGNYIVEVSFDQSISPAELPTKLPKSTITLRGVGANRTISFASNDSMFTVGSGVTLILDSNITLQGRGDNTSSLVRIEGGALEMKAGSKITVNTNNTNTTFYSGGSGVYVSNSYDYNTYKSISGTFTMNGGEISGNSGGGVSVAFGGTFTMNGGTISGNTSYSGGGVSVSGGTFTMNGGTIYGNTASNGGGVSVSSSGTFTMSGGEISGNTATEKGGGVYVNGVYDDYNGSYLGGTFTKTGGTIYGYSASDAAKSNKVKDYSDTIRSGKGHAVYASLGGYIRYRETTTGPGVNLHFNGNDSTSTGAWDNVPAPGSLAEKLEQLFGNTQTGSEHTLEVDANESIEPFTLTFGNRSNITITLKGVGANRTLTLASNGSMFTVNSGVTLVLDNNITLQGRSDNTSSLVRIEGGKLVMKTGSKITGNTNTTFYSDVGGGGVYVTDQRYRDSNTGTETIVGGTLTMSGGTISGNTANNGGGVYVGGGTFTMESGTISGNTAETGGGVHVYIGSFDFTTRTFVVGTFTMSGGTISGNTSRYEGGGVYLTNGGGHEEGTNYVGGIFTKTGGTIYGYSEDDTINSNAVKDSSGGVYYDGSHAVYAYYRTNYSSDFEITKRKGTTAGPGVNLSFNCSNGDYSGAWDD